MAERAAGQGSIGCIELAENIKGNRKFGGPLENRKGKNQKERLGSLTKGRGISKDQARRAVGSPGGRPYARTRSKRGKETRKFEKTEKTIL